MECSSDESTGDDAEGSTKQVDDRPVQRIKLRVNIPESACHFGSHRLNFAAGFADVCVGLVPASIGAAFATVPASVDLVESPVDLLKAEVDSFRELVDAFVGARLGHGLHG